MTITVKPSQTSRPSQTFAHQIFVVLNISDYPSPAQRGSWQYLLVKIPCMKVAQTAQQHQ